MKLLFALAPIGGKINQCHFGDLGFFAKNMYFVLCIFGAGQKNNQCHGTVALASSAPLPMRYDCFKFYTSSLSLDSF